MSDFVFQCVTYLLTMDLLYFVGISLCILVVGGLIRFIITLVEDDLRTFKKHNRKTARRRKSHRRRVQDIDSVC